jgi:2'-5' RNA ligase
MMPAGEASAETLRAFIAVDVGEVVAERAAVIIKRFQSTVATDMKWVEPRNLHLTLKFLGETRRSDLPRLSEALREAAAGMHPFDLELAGVGLLPNWRWPQVVYLGVRGDTGSLKALTAAIELACWSLGYERERKPFHPHLTLGRTRTREGMKRLEQAAIAVQREGDLLAGAVRVERFALVQSQLQPGGPLYSVLESFPLIGSQSE